ncbi:hypothetical protein D2M30_4256 [Bacillus amyloliquefaciens]|uniref:hypothetical protein n=1 Tax=Bacillus amyloliquefaciens TaxID=1390 RepID=UPI000F6305A5|nr:hypothetical protein [Bacillus amyloliquefaciens]QBG58551.1 hypothetical protein D2M30_4256 [Bacillus amyloliquefaciens]
MSGLGFSVLPYITVRKEVKAETRKFFSSLSRSTSIISPMLVKKKKWQLPTAETFVSLVLEMIFGLILKPMRESIGLFLRQGIFLLIKA